MDDPPDLGSPISVNKHGGLYELIKAYWFTKKWEVVVIFVCNYFEQNEILVMDKAQIHMAGKAECAKHYLWNMIKIVYLPTRCPKLNPIEFMFHLLSDLVRSFQYGLWVRSTSKWSH
jgi:transposase